MDSKRIGIVGVGSIACGRHIPELLAIDNCQITAICDIDENRLITVGDQLGIPHELRFTDYNDLIASTQVYAKSFTHTYCHSGSKVWEAC